MSKGIKKADMNLPDKQAESLLYSDVCSLIENTRQRLAATANAEACIMHWQIGKRIKEDVLYNKRAEYGKQVVKNLAKKLTGKYGGGWSDRKLLHCIRAAYTFSEDQIVYAARTQLTWTHLRSIMFIEDELKRSFYMEMCRLEHWDTRTLNEKIDSQLYELTALSKKPEEVIKQELAKIKDTNALIPDIVFRSDYFLDMLGLTDVYSEKDLEDAILIQIQSFIKELGSDFAFLDRQKRITVDAVDYFIDLLFYHRRLRRLVVIDLKLGKFKPEYEGQMLLYLRYLNKNERMEGEESPIGLILCSEGNTEHIEYLMLDDNNIRVAQYYTQLPDKKLLSEKLQRAIAIAKEHHANAAGKRSLFKS
ncbi:MAG: PDDEXK nuclease domain-containing protein [Chitinispirillales bacterium]|jgi:predicted nuclease of restriction endonuclease-like (RecB) superfamily|nr:PDDEXK nuclease domain-containing protein [Chitinispirillales bacterium]